MTFPGSQLVWQYFPGEGLALHPLANFGKLNALAGQPPQRRGHGAAARRAARPRRCRAAAALAWEYYFDFDGGKPPWVSGLAQGTAAAGDRARGRRGSTACPSCCRGSAPALVMFTQAPPDGRARGHARGRALRAVLVRAGRCASSTGSSSRSSGSTTSAQLTGDPEAQRLFAEGDAEARAEVPLYDTGAWSHYSRGAVTHESDLSYHTLLRDFLANLCDRTLSRRLLHGRDALHELPDRRRRR